MIENKLTLKFNTGEVELPEPGNYIISAGCGSGKTSMVKRLLMDAWKEAKDISLLYSAKTINECNLMYEYCINVGYDPTKIAVLHSEIPKDTYFEYLSNPDKLGRASILICTHAQLMSLPPEYTLFIPNKLGITNMLEVCFGLTEKKLHRKFIIIDESIEALGLKTYMSVKDFDLRYECLDASIVIKPINRWVQSDVDNLYNFYKDRYKLNEYDSIEAAKDIKQSLIDSFIFNYALLNIDKNRVREVNVNGRLVKELFVPIQNQIRRNTSDVIKALIDPYLLILDGTGDINYKGITDCEIIKLANPTTNYELNKLELSLDRRTNYDTKEDFDNFVQSIITEISPVIDSGYKTLIITYKNLSGWIDDDIPAELKGSKLEFNDLIYSKLDSSRQEKCTCIYYQSGLDKATNQFRDYDQVIFLGQFHINKEGILSHNYYNGTQYTALDHSLQLMIQGLFRTRIRNYKDEPIKIFVSSDHSDRLLNLVNRYLQTGDMYNKCLAREEGYEDYTNSRYYKWVEPLLKYKPELISNMEFLPDMKMVDIGYFTLAEFRDIVGIRSKGELSDYLGLVTYLKKFDIRVHVYTYRGNYPKVKNRTTGKIYEIDKSEVEEYLTHDWELTGFSKLIE